MKKQRKIGLSIFFSFILMMSMSFCLATSSNKIIINEDALENVEDIKYIDNYEDYEEILNSEDKKGYTQEELKEGYESYQKYLKEFYLGHSKNKVIKAKIVEAKEVEEKYEFNEYYYLISKFDIQPLNVQILEGEHKGEVLPIDFLLTGDSLGNTKYSKLKVGDVIFVDFFQNPQTGEIKADITNAGANVERFGVIFVLAIITAIVWIVYGGKKGVIGVLITMLILDFSLLIIPVLGFEGKGFIISGTLFTLLLISTITISKLGINKKALKGILISIISTIFAILMVLVGNALTRTVGITFEVAAVSENVILGNINFETLFYIITMIISSVAITNVVCDIIPKLAEKQNAKDKFVTCRDSINNNLIMTITTLMAVYIPNHLLLLTNQYSSDEIFNAEILISEIIRIFVIVIATCIAIPLTIIML